MLNLVVQGLLSLAATVPFENLILLPLLLAPGLEIESALEISLPGMYYTSLDILPSCRIRTSVLSISSFVALYIYESSCDERSFF